MSRLRLRADAHKQRFPRVSGDEPYMPTLKALVDGFSPRERG